MRTEIRWRYEGGDKDGIVEMYVEGMTVTVIVTPIAEYTDETLNFAFTATSKGLSKTVDFDRVR